MKQETLTAMSGIPVRKGGEDVNADWLTVQVQTL